MKEQINNSLYISLVDLLEEKINTNILTEDIEDIIEVTYAYKEFDDKTAWNTTLFSKLL
jgi:hypothetical protein